MKIIQIKNQDAYLNLALEDYVFYHMNPVEDSFLLWQNRSAVVVGKHQNPIEEVNLDFITKHDVQVARRLSGGGAVYHDLGNLNYSIIAHSDEMRWEIKRMADPIVKVLRASSVDVQVSERNDLLIDGKKISGSSQYIKGKRLLHHGTLLFHSDLKMLSESLKPSKDRIESRSIKSVRSPVTNICDHYPHITTEEFISKLRGVLGEDAVIEEYELTDSNLEAISALREEKYSTWDWVYGRSPEYNIRKVREFNGIEMDISLVVKNGIIQALQLDGDFGGKECIRKIEESIMGVKVIEGEVYEALSALVSNSCIHGLDAASLARMIVR